MWGNCVPGKMGFGKDLKNSHEGLIKLQDWELKLLETVKRFMTLRVKSDKEYASHLLNISQQVDKQDNSSQIHYISTVSKVINTFFFDSLTLFELGVVSLAQIINKKKNTGKNICLLFYLAMIWSIIAILKRAFLAWKNEEE